MAASGSIPGAFSRGTTADERGRRAPRRPSRYRRRPRIDDLEPRLLLSGTPSIREFPVPSPNAEPIGIALGPDGNLWFTEWGPNGSPRIGRITTSGVVTGFAAGLTAERQPVGIAAGPDGNLWFAEPAGDRIGRITTSGVLTEFSAGITPDAEPFGITLGPDGNLWFTETGAIGRITTAGVVTEFTAGIPPGDEPLEITSGPDGNLWFTETGGIGRITTTGVITEFSARINAGGGPSGITAGPDGNLWFTEDLGNRIGRITPAGVVTEFSAGITAGSQPEGITVGPDGNLWFTEQAGNRIGRITTAGVVIEFTSGISATASPRAIAVGPDGNLWFTEGTGHRIGRLDLSLPASGTNISTTEGQPFVGTVATFTDGDPSAAPGDFTATIDWGDGTTSAGQILEDASGTFYVSGSHTYAEESFFIPIGVTIADSDGDTTTASSAAFVAQAPLLATGVPVSATEGAAVRDGTIVATFVDTGGAQPPGQYTATINWGDGTADLAGIRRDGATFEVVSAAPHIYRAPGSFTVLVTILDLDPGNPRNIVGSALAGSTATVADARLTEIAVPVPAAQPRGTPLAGVVVGSFFDGNSFAVPADFTATIDWGDGSPTSLGAIAQPNGPGSAFVVEGSHTYAVAGTTPYSVTVAVSDRGGRGLTTGTALPVTDAPPIASGIPVRMTKRLPFTGARGVHRRWRRVAARGGGPLHGDDQLGRRHLERRDHRGRPGRRLGGGQPPVRRAPVRSRSP